MKTFKDNEKREWKVVVNVATAKAVKDLTGVDIFNIYVDEANKLFSDPITFVNVLYVLCKKQCEERKMSDEEFGAAMTGDSLDEAANAVLIEVADFFPEARRKIMHKMREKAGEQAKAMEAKALEMLDKIDPTTLPQPTK